MRSPATRTADATSRSHPTALLPLAAALVLALLPATSLARPAPTPSRDQLARGLSALVRAGSLSAAEYAELARRAGLDLAPAAPTELRKCGTVDLFLVRAWARAQGVRPRDLPAPAPAGTVSSSRFPITVAYRTGEAARAASLLSAAERVWQRQVVELGYPAPWTLDETGAVKQGMLFGTDDSRDYGGVTIPLGNVDQTPRCDCSCRIVISSSTSEAELFSVVGHEFNHATQFATDCGESISAFENFATAVEFVENARSDHFTELMISEFQTFSQYSLDYWTQDYGYGGGDAPSMLYQYGAALFPLFLLDRYGNGDPAFLRKLWDSFAQEGFVDMSGYGSICSNGNAPNWFEGIDQVLAQQGASFATAFDEFSAWRTIVGRRDDGKHFRGGSRISEPGFDASLSLGAGKAEGDAFEYGSRYFQLTRLDAHPPIRIDVTGDPEASWSGSVVLWKSGGAEVVPLTFQGNVGTLQLGSLAGVTRGILVVSQLKDDAHSPDDYDWTSNRAFSVKAQETPSATPDGEVTGGTEAGVAPADSGCSCSTAAGASALPQLALLLGLALRLHRRRSNA